jgi:peptide methionine sulfoxide reductase msrA/msrB
MHDFLDKQASLTPSAQNIILNKATEPPHTGKYNTVASDGSYLCRRCGLGLFRASSQFAGSCGWPSFDDIILLAVKTVADADGMRMEVLCNRCDAHLGHVFDGEYFTAKNRRYCINAASIDFVQSSTVIDTLEAIVAGGCFWGVDHFLGKISGVLHTEVGYTGGSKPSPSYEQVCCGDTGHYEALRVVYDTAQTDYHIILKRFFEIHDPTQHEGQNPDFGQQYQSAVFYYNDKQHATATALLQHLQQKGYATATKLLPVAVFWPGEEYHQDYYVKHRKLPYCHSPVARFD